MREGKRLCHNLVIMTSNDLNTVIYNIIDIVHMAVYLFETAHLGRTCKASPPLSFAPRSPKRVEITYRRLNISIQPT